MFKTFLFIPLAAVFQGGTQQVFAQQEPERKVRIEIVTNENGDTQRITKEFDASNEQEIQDALKDLGVLEHINMNGDGENVTIDIRRSGGASDDDVFLHMAPLPPLPEATCEPKAYLGVATKTVDTELAEERGLSVRSGALVEEVVEGSAAEKAGIMVGDVVVKLGGKAVQTSQDLVELVQAKDPGDKVELVWDRSGKKMSGRVELGERSAKSFAYAFGPGSEEEHMEWRSFLDDASEHGSKAFLGVTPGEGNGAMIGSVEEGSAAETMGIQAGDRIVGIDSKTITDFDDLASTIGAMSPGDQVQVRIERNGEEQLLSGTLGERRMERFHFEFDESMNDWMGQLEGVKGWSPEVRDELRREMDVLRKELEELRRDMGKELRVETRITIEAFPLDAKEKELLKSKGVDHLDSPLRIDGMRVFPNPSNGFFRIQFDVPEQGDLFVNVHDSGGEKVYEERISSFKGRYERTLDLSDKATGSYFLVIQQGQKSATSKLVKE